MEKLPFDVIINNIMPYIYNIQPKFLLEDIKNYHKIRKILIDDKYDIDIIKHELISLFYFNEHNKKKLNNILHRQFKINLKKYDYEIIEKYPQNTKFNIIFGLFTKEERIYFSEYILEDLKYWILK